MGRDVYCIHRPDALWKPHLRNHRSKTNLTFSFLCVDVEKRLERVVRLAYPKSWRIEIHSVDKFNNKNTKLITMKPEKNEVTCSDVGELNPRLIVSMPTMASLVEGDALPGSLQNKKVMTCNPRN